MNIVRHRKGLPSGLTLWAIALSIASLATAGEPVAIEAGADGAYVQRKFGDGHSHVQSEHYVFGKGTFFGGGLRDSSVEQEQFLSVARTLEPALERQHYYPAKGSAEADQLIVVHWGITGVAEDASNGQMDVERTSQDVASFNRSVAKSGISDAGAIYADVDTAEAKGSPSNGDMEFNAKLVGFSSALNEAEYRSVASATGMTDLDHELRADLADERYFVILMAYDMNSLRHRAAGTKPKLLWKTHMSIRAIGRNFQTALPQMSSVASAYFGHSSQGLVLDAAGVPAGRVDIGQPRTVPERRP
jgi:hypothetical protein